MYSYSESLLYICITINKQASAFAFCHSLKYPFFSFSVSSFSSRHILTFKSLWMNMSLGSKSYINKQLYNTQDYNLLFPYLRTVVYEFYSGFYGKPDSLKA